MKTIHASLVMAISLQTAGVADELRPIAPVPVSGVVSARVGDVPASAASQRRTYRFTNYAGSAAQQNYAPDTGSRTIYALPNTAISNPQNGRLPARQTSGSIETVNVGPICIPAAAIRLNETNIEIGQSGYQLNGPLLSGLVLRYDESATSSNGTRKVTGLALFTGGTLASQLQDSTNAADDSIFRHEGSIEGTILGSDSAGILITTKAGALTKVSLADVSYIRSPKAFVFTMTGMPIKQAGSNVPALRTEVQSVTFQPTTSASAKGISLSSVVPHKDPLLDDLADDDDDMTSFFGKTGVPKTTRDDGSIAPTFGPSARPFPSWP